MFLRSSTLIQAFITLLFWPLCALAASAQSSPEEIKIAVNSTQSAYPVELATPLSSSDQQKICPSGRAPASSSLNYGSEDIRAERVRCEGNQLKASFAIPLRLLKSVLPRIHELESRKSCQKGGAEFFNLRDQGQIQAKWGPANIDVSIKVIAVCN